MPLFRKKASELPTRRQGGTTGDVRRTVHSDQASDQNTTFRRNRTLTGSLSSHVSSAGEPLADLKSPRTHAHDLTRQRRKVGGVFLGVIIICGLFAGLLFEFTARPVVNASDGSISLQQDRYEKAVNDYLAAHPIERLRFVLNRQRLNEYIGRTLSEVISINPEGSAGFGASQFNIVVRKPLVGWLIGSTQYFVDSNGVPFRVNYYDTPSVRIIDQSGIQQAAGTAIASTRFLNFVGRAVSVAHDYGLVVEQAIIPADTTRQIQLRIQSHDYPIKLSLDRPVGEQVEDMQRTIAYLDSKGLKPQYVDVRVSGKAFYK